MAILPEAVLKFFWLTRTLPSNIPAIFPEPRYLLTGKGSFNNCKGNALIFNAKISP
ncbi:MAG: hypothetical protein MJK14_22950 [Rivularia sp. ALOHA_DT_140]|nr:hypothetical protein [Rivularia sp. ALOHA_DT_140]